MDFPDKRDIHGISAFINKDDIRSNVDLEDIEKKIVSGNLFVDNDEAENTVALQYADAMNMIFEDNKEEIDVISKKSYMTHNIQDNFNDSDDNFNEEYQGNINDINSFKNYNKPYSINNSNYNSNYKLENQKKSNILNQFLNTNNNINKTTDKYNSEPENLEEDKELMIEQIENLKNELEMENVDVSKYEINRNESYIKIQETWKKLKLKSQYKTYANMFNESILVGTEFVEWAFDGERDYMGYKPNMTGWSDTVKIKLKRMRLESASFVSGVMQNYQMSSGMSIFSQLAISAVLYSVTKRKDLEERKNLNHITNTEWKNAMNDMD